MLQSICALRRRYRKSASSQVTSPSTTLPVVRTKAEINSQSEADDCHRGTFTKTDVQSQ